MDTRTGGETGEDRAFHGSRSSGKNVQRNSVKAEFAIKLKSHDLSVDHKLNFSNILIIPQNLTGRS